MDNNATKKFTLDTFLTVINLTYKNLFYHQPFDGLSIIYKTKKGNISLENIVTIKINIKYINQILLKMNNDFQLIF